MKMKSHLASLVILLGTSCPLFSATELERLRALCAEQEMQIQHLEEKIARLTDSPPPPRKSKTSTSPISEDTTATSTYTVKAGDNIERIARNHNTSASTLYKINNLKPDSIIRPGQKIKLSDSTSAPANQSATTTTTRKHTIKSGETFYRIANNYGITVNQLSAANPSVNYSALKVGQVITIPGSTNIAKAPEPKPTPTLSPTPSVPVINNPAPVKQPERNKQRLIKIENEITYRQFAQTHNTTTDRLDQLNALQLDPATVLARGSELYVPAQP